MVRLVLQGRGALGPGRGGKERHHHDGREGVGRQVLLRPNVRLPDAHPSDDQQMQAEYRRHRRSCLHPAFLPVL